MDLGVWFVTVFGHWQNWLSGSGLGGIVTIVVGALSYLDLWKMPKRWYAAVFIGFFFVGANYMAWHDAYSSMKGRESDLHSTEGLLAQERHRNEDLRRQLYAKAPTAATRYIESQNSLRRRTKKLADEVEWFSNDRDSHHPPHSNGVVTATGEQARINQESQRYDEESVHLCLAKFGDRFRGTVSELKAAGVDLSPGPESGYFESLIEQHRCLEPWVVAKFRNLSYRIDALGKLIVF